MTLLEPKLPPCLHLQIFIEKYAKIDFTDNETKFFT